MSRKTKRFLLLNFPYVLFALMGTKLGQSWRYAPGAGFSEKLLHLVEGMAAAFQSAMPSFIPFDLFFGIIFGDRGEGIQSDMQRDAGEFYSHLPELIHQPFGEMEPGCRSGG